MTVQKIMGWSTSIIKTKCCKSSIHQEHPLRRAVLYRPHRNHQNHFMEEEWPNLLSDLTTVHQNIILFVI